MCLSQDDTTKKAIRVFREALAHEAIKHINMLLPKDGSVGMPDIFCNMPDSARFSSTERTHLAYSQKQESCTRTKKMKANKLIKRWLADSIKLSESDLHKFIVALLKHHPLAQNEGFSTTPKIYQSLQGQILPRHYGYRSGSCMEGPALENKESIDDALDNTYHRWAELNETLAITDDKPLINPTPSAAEGAYTLIWSDLPYAITKGENVAAVRAFLWAVEDMEGNKSYLVDRAYPSTPDTRELTKNLAEKHGWYCYDKTGAGCHNSEELPALVHHLAEPLDGANQYPWLDSLNCAEDGGITLSTPACNIDAKVASVTTGQWFGGECADCGDRCDEDTQGYNAGGDPVCENCSNDYVHCDNCEETIAIDDAHSHAGSSHTSYYCSHYCAAQDDIYPCGHCDDMISQDSVEVVSPDEVPYCSSECAEDEGVGHCSSCCDPIHTCDSIEAQNGHYYCDEDCAENEGIGECSECCQYVDIDELRESDNANICDDCITKAFYQVQALSAANLKYKKELEAITTINNAERTRRVLLRQEIEYTHTRNLRPLPLRGAYYTQWIAPAIGNYTYVMHRH